MKSADREAVVERLHVHLRVDVVDQLAPAALVERADHLGQLAGEGAIDADGAVERQTHVALHVRAARVAGEPIERSAAHPVGDQAGEAIQ